MLCSVRSFEGSHAFVLLTFVDLFACAILTYYCALRWGHRWVQLSGCVPTWPRHVFSDGGTNACGHVGGKMHVHTGIPCCADALVCSFFAT